MVEVLEHVSPTPEVLASLSRLRKGGFTLAMDDYAGEDELKPFLEHVDILKMDILALEADPKRIRAALDGLPNKKLILLAEKVEDQATFELCSELGFHLFQGFFFSRPEIIPGKKVSANEAAKLQLLKELSHPDFELTKLAKIINTDPALSYRLFRYINSAGMGISRKVESVSHATTLLGQLKVSQWLRAVILSDLNPAPTAQEVSFLSLHRAKFLQTISEELDLGGKTPDILFTLGLFSLLDSLMGIEMDVILKELPLDEDVAGALTGEENELQGLLRLVEAYEKGDFKGMTEFAQQHGLLQEALDTMYTDGMRWVLSVLAKDGD
ncbi:MAG: HDOD domain-containing protein [Proteobacteria bacterium]|nr:HDOD domain-containing protein [Pseudomonadota bacterium]